MWPTSLGPYLYAVRGRLAVACGAMAMLAAASAVFAMLTGPAIALLFAGSEAQTSVVPMQWGRWLPSALAPTAAHLPYLLLATAVLKGVAQATQFYSLGAASLEVQRLVRRDAFAHIVQQSPSFFAKHPQGDLLARLSSDAHAIEHALFYGLGPLVRDGMALAALFVFCAVSQPWLTASTLLLGPVAALALKRFSVAFKRIVSKGREQHGALATHLCEVFGGVQEMQQCQREEYEQERLHALDVAWKQTALGSYFVRAIRTPCMEVLATAAIALLLAAHGQSASAAHSIATSAGYVSFATAVLFMYEPLKKIGQAHDHLMAGQVAAERLMTLMQERESPKESADPIHLDRAHGLIQWRDVHFAYGEKLVLMGVSARIAPGETVAIAGPSGVGKSTLIRLLMRWFDVSAGSICIDGYDIRSLSLHSLRAQIGIVSQEPFLFRGSAFDNIGYGRKGASRRDIEAAADAAQALPFLRALPNGLDTPLGERGMTLSGGQKQRIAIARALLRDAPLLVLDEATSQLDAHNEQAVDEAMQAVTRGRTTLVISHRATTLARADRILVLEHGRLREAAATASQVGDMPTGSRSAKNVVRHV